MSSASLVQNVRLDVVAPVAVTNDGVLPSDILYEVLLRLPANVLCRLRLVCRSWRSLTSDRLFAIAHSLRHPLLVGVHQDGHEIHTVDFSGNIIKRIRLKEPAAAGLSPISTHGDLLCVSNKSSPETSGEACTLNIATGATTTLPVVLPSRARAATCVLGHVPSTNQYKVLRMQMYVQERTNRMIKTCHVMTLGDPRWRARPYAPVLVVLRLGHTAVVDGVAYFSVNQVLDYTGQDCIASFDMALEEWKPKAFQGPLSTLLSVTGERLLPQEHVWFHFRLAALAGCLVVSHHNSKHFSTDLWFLEDMDAAIWTKRYSMWWTPDLRAIPTDTYYPRCIYPLVISTDGRIVVWVDEARALRAYDPETRTWTGLATSKDYSAVGMHHGSLLCPGL